jgi:hypothetical protein
MLMSLFQVAGQLTPEQLAELQKLGVQGGIPAAGGALGAITGAMIGFTIIFAIVGIVIGVLALFNLYHLIMTDKAPFEKAGTDKKKWYYNLVLIPVISSLVMIIPFIGWVVGGIGSIYSLVMILIYFFSIRKKVV